MDGRQINWSAQKSHILYVGMDPIAPKSLQLLEGEGWTNALQCVEGVSVGSFSGGRRDVGDWSLCIGRSMTRKWRPKFQLNQCWHTCLESTKSYCFKWECWAETFCLL